MGAFFVFGFPFATLAGAFCETQAKLPTYQVAKVIDGDTLRLVDGRSVRLIGINTPERGRDGHADEPLAREAAERLRRLVQGSGGTVRLQQGRQARDNHGRLLAHAYDAQGRNLEAMLLSEGLGLFVAVSPNAALVDCHARAEQAARDSGLGVWRQLVARAPESIRRSGFAVVRGRIERVDRNRGGVWLELGGPLVLQVERKAGFDEAALARLVGRDVEARGWVVDRKGRTRAGQARWLLRLTHPTMLRPAGG